MILQEKYQVKYLILRVDSRGDAVNLIDFTREYIGRKYKLGEVDCLRLVYDYLIKLGHTPPVTYSGWNINNYSELYLQDKSYALRLMVEYLESFLQLIDENAIMPGDIVVLSYNFSDAFLGIVCANNKVLVAMTDQVVMTILSAFDLGKVFRCQVQPH
jgi:hypothetical protein